MGNAIQKVSASAHIIASDKAWIESDAISQLKYVSNLKYMQHVVGLPDLHPGRTYPIGAACLSSKHIYPALVGNDIGCGMSLWNLNLSSKKIKLDKWEKRLRQGAFTEQPLWSKQGVDMLETRSSAQALESNREMLAQSEHSFGTIGGGNHFSEIQQLSTIFDEDAAKDLNLSKNDVLLLVHSGSRGLGERILRKHVDVHSHDGVAADSQAGVDYMAQHDLALRWAEVNRYLIAERLLSALSCKGELLLDVNHNFVEEVSSNQGMAYLHRKGATPADKGYVVIPGSRGTASYIVKPLDCGASLQSLAHGAGRKWQRSECEGRLKHKYKLKELQRTKIGSRVICDNRELAYQEAPEAYKPIDGVISDLVTAGLIKVVAELKPLISYKTADPAKSTDKKSSRGRSCC